MSSSATSERARPGLDYPAVTCVFVCHDGHGRILLHRRGPGARDERGRWDSGAGALAHGETFEQAVRREVVEEFGAAPRRIEPLGVRNVLRPLDGEVSHWVAVMFAVELDPAEARLGEPHKFDALEWFALDGPLPEPRHSQLHHALDAFRAARRGA
ncbi:MAG TPA: NUDIX domain-containing protein [Conexibacter sp.]|nr:NUDIX domain-containing protein [Conexibacter sp.]